MATFDSLCGVVDIEQCQRRKVSLPYTLKFKRLLSWEKFFAIIFLACGNNHHCKLAQSHILYSSWKRQGRPIKKREGWRGGVGTVSSSYPLSFAIPQLPASSCLCLLCRLRSHFNLCLFKISDGCPCTFLVVLGCVCQDKVDSVRQDRDFGTPNFI